MRRGDIAGLGSWSRYHTTPVTGIRKLPSSTTVGSRIRLSDECGRHGCDPERKSYQENQPPARCPAPVSTAVVALFLLKRLGKCMSTPLCLIPSLCSDRFSVAVVVRVRT